MPYMHSSSVTALSWSSTMYLEHSVHLWLSMNYIKVLLCNPYHTFIALALLLMSSINQSQSDLTHPQWSWSSSYKRQSRQFYFCSWNALCSCTHCTWLESSTMISRDIQFQLHLMWYLQQLALLNKATEERLSKSRKVSRNFHIKIAYNVLHSLFFTPLKKYQSRIFRDLRLFQVEITGMVLQMMLLSKI